MHSTWTSRRRAEATRTRRCTNGHTGPHRRLTPSTSRAHRAHRGMPLPFRRLRARALPPSADLTDRTLRSHRNGHGCRFLLPPSRASLPTARTRCCRRARTGVGRQTRRTAAARASRAAGPRPWSRPRRSASFPHSSGPGSVANPWGPDWRALPTREPWRKAGALSGPCSSEGPAPLPGRTLHSADSRRSDDATRPRLIEDQRSASAPDRSREWP
mmetsp:Transcript_12640/g.46691  ORF Transcript_12640/g.46691 Transcript_12640/m.46691 type:complete len:215 (-) Transcript_12640:35-679(-)